MKGEGKAPILPKPDAIVVETPLLPLGRTGPPTQMEVSTPPGAWFGSMSGDLLSCWQDALAEAEASVMEAEAISSDSRRAGAGRRNANGPMSPGASADQDMRALVSTVDKARRAAGNAAQVRGLGFEFAGPVRAKRWSRHVHAQTATTHIIQCTFGWGA